MQAKEYTTTHKPCVAIAAGVVPIITGILFAVLYNPDELTLLPKLDCNAPEETEGEHRASNNSKVEMMIMI